MVALRGEGMIVYCLGMQSSGSTWLYNIARELLLAADKQHVAFRVELYEHLLDDRCFGTHDALLRGHTLESGMLRLLNLTGVKAVLSFREPRDAVASFVQRFGDYGAQFLPTCNDIARNLASLLSASQILNHISFFYEDRFTEDLDSVRRLADFLGLSVAAVTQAEIFDKYRAGTVKAFIANIDKLSEDRLFIDQARNAMDRETSFHRTHISDMRVGKWRDVLTKDQQEAVSELFDGYAHLLEDRAIGEGRLPGPLNWVEPLRGFNVTFTSTLFAPVQDIHDAPHLLHGQTLLSGLGMQILRDIYLPQGRWRFCLHMPTLDAFELRTCQNGQVILEAKSDGHEVTFEYSNKLHDHPFDLHVIYDGMNDDAAADALPPPARLEATFMPH